MRKTILVVASVAVAMVVLGGVAWAANIQCTKSRPSVGFFPTCEGTQKADRMMGTSTPDSMFGRGGADIMYGLDSGDNLNGGDDSDKLYGGPDPDSVSEQAGPDKLYGGAGEDNFTVGPSGRDDLVNDYVHGGKNKDFFRSPGNVDGTVESGVDRYYGNDGDDRIFVDSNAGPEDSAKDVVTCGPGSDRVWFNEGVDIVDAATCEQRFPQ